MEPAAQYKVLALPLVDGPAAKTPVPGVTKHPSVSQYYLAMPKTTSSTVLLEEMAVTVAADRSAARISVLGQQAQTWLMALLVSI
jgi:hypothetical protein